MKMLAALLRPFLIWLLVCSTATAAPIRLHHVVPGNIPASVIAAGLQTTYAHKDDTGASASFTTHTPQNTPSTITNAGGFCTPDCSTANSVVNLRGGTFTDWDFRGHSVQIDGGVTVAFSNVYFSRAGSTSNFLGIGTNGPGTGPSADVVTADHCTIDGLGSADTYEAPVKNYGTTTFTFCRWINDPLDHISQVYGTLTLTDDYFEAPGNDPRYPATCSDPIVSHAEAIHTYSGTTNMTRVYFDGSTAGAFLKAGNWTSTGPYIQAVEAQHGETFATISSSIISGGMAAVGCNGATPVASITENDGATVKAHLTVSSSLLSLGTSFYVKLGLTVPGSGFTDGGGNRDWLTGLIVPLP